MPPRPAIKKNVSKSAPVITSFARRLRYKRKAPTSRPVRRMRRTNYRRRRYHPGRITSMKNRYEPIVPASYLSKFEFISSTITAVTGSAQTFFAFGSNCLFQPQLTQNTGSVLAPANANILNNTDRALGLSQFSALYDQYRVYKTVVEVEGAVVTANVPVYLFVGSDPDQATAAQPATGNLRQTLQSRQFVHKVYTNIDPFKFKRTFYPHTILGVSRAMYNSDNLTMAATNGSNPQTSPPIWVGFGSLNASTSVTISCRVRLIFYAQLFGPQPITAGIAPSFTMTPQGPVCDDCAQSMDSEDDMTDVETITKSQIQKIKKLISTK